MLHTRILFPGPGTVDNPGPVWFIPYNVMNDSSHSVAPIVLRLLQVAAITCSFPSWLFIAGLAVYRFWLDGSFWPQPYQWTLPGIICVVCTLVSLALYPFSVDVFAIGRQDVFWILWASFPLMLGLGLGGLLWLSTRLGLTDMNYYWGWS